MNGRCHLYQLYFGDLAIPEYDPLSELDQCVVISPCK